MTDDKLADEISRQLFARDDDSVSLNEEQWQQIILSKLPAAEAEG